MWPEQVIFRLSSDKKNKELNLKVSKIKTTSIPFSDSKKTKFQQSYNTPLEHTPGNPPTQLWKDSLYNLLVKV